MKTIKFSLFAVAAMAAVSCLNEANPENGSQVNPNLVEVSLTAVGESDEETKAVFSGYPKIAWEGNEEISLLGTNTGNQKLTANEKGHQTTFTGYADVTDDVYYAVYPYDANVGLAYTTDDKGKEIVKITSVTVPAVQTATAGSFDPKSYIAVAKSTDKENLYFKTVGAFIKFQLEDAENVKSVTIVSNTNKNMACSAAVEIKDDGSVAHGSPYVDGTTNTSVKMVGDFVSGKHYFMVVRPQPYDGGITVYIEYKDGTVLSRKGESALYESGKSRNHIRNLNILKKADFAPVTDLYALYEMGYDIHVGDIIINKEINNTATHIQASSESKEIAVNGGVYFVDPDIELTIAANTYNNLYIIGNNATNRTSVKVTGTIKWATNNTLAFKNIDIQEGEGLSAQLFQAVNGGNIIIDNCKLTPNNYTTFYSYQSKIDAVKIYNSDILVIKDNTPVLIGAGQNKTINISTLELYNNIIYSSNGDKFGFRITNHTGISVESLNIKKNTIANVYNYNVAADKDNEGYYKLSNNNAGYLNTGTVTKYNLEDNLFYTPQYDTYKNTTITDGVPNHSSASTMILSPAAQETIATNNMHLKTENNNRLRTTTNGDFLSKSINASDIVSDVNLSVGTIVSKGTYGATR